MKGTRRQNETRAEAGGRQDPTLDLKLELLVSEPRARTAFDSLGLTTVSDFLATDQEAFVSIPGVGPKTFELVRDRLSAIVGSIRPRADEPSPQGLVESASESSEEQVAALAPPTTAGSLVLGLLEHIDPDSRDALRAVLDQTATRNACLSRYFDVPPTRVDEPLGELRERLLALRPAETRCLLACAAEELRVRGGVLTTAMVSPGRMLAREVRSAPRRHWPLRLCAFLRPERWHFEDGALLDCSESEWRSVLTDLREELSRCELPLRIENFAERMRRRSGDVTCVSVEPLFRHALLRSGRATIRFRKGAEWIHRNRTDLASRLEWILRRSERALELDDLLFRLRDIYQRGSRNPVAAALRSDRRFVQVGPETFDLRIRRVDELEMARPLADLWRRRILAADGRVEVAPPDSRIRASAFFAADLLRGDAAVRSLGRGTFCARGRGSSTLDRLVRDLRQAKGAVPFARFLQNQCSEKRRLKAQLLRLNRAFVSPAPDLVDLAENYPLQGDRLDWLLRDVGMRLEERGGYMPVGDLCAEIRSDGLLGSFFTEHLLLDVLRRNTRLEVVAEAFVADPALHLADWIRARIRQTLRTAGTPITRDELIATCPTLAEFDAVLGHCLDSDPLVVSPDQMHFQLA